MFVKSLFLGICMRGKFFGELGIFIAFGDNKNESITPTKLIDRAIALSRNTKRIFLFNDVNHQNKSELAFLIGDLRDIKKDVIVEVDECTTLGDLSSLPSWISILAENGHTIRSNRVDEIFWIINNETNSIPVSGTIIPESISLISKCFYVLSHNPALKFSLSTELVMRIKT